MTMPRYPGAFGSRAYDTPDFYGREYVGVCKEIQRYARCGRVRVVPVPGMAGIGGVVQLEDLLLACGVTVGGFLLGYLCRLQPYAMSRCGDVPGFMYYARDMEGHFGVLLDVRGDGVVAALCEPGQAGVPGGFDGRGYCVVLVDSVQQGVSCFEVGYVVQHGFISVYC